MIKKIYHSFAKLKTLQVHKCSIYTYGQRNNKKIYKHNNKILLFVVHGKNKNKNCKIKQSSIITSLSVTSTTGKKGKERLVGLGVEGVGKGVGELDRKDSLSLILFCQLNKVGHFIFLKHYASVYCSKV